MGSFLRTDSEVARALQDAEYGVSAPRPRSDSDVARELAAGGSGAGASAAGASAGAGAGGASGTASFRRFQVYHYNGLSDPGRAPVTVCLSVTQPDDAQPMMDLTDGAQVTSNAAAAIQAVLRTKWPGAAVVPVPEGTPPPKLD